MKLTIIRSQATAAGVYGELFVDGARFCATCERPWLDNRQGVSCIPAGDYELRPHNSPKHGAIVAFHAPELGVYAEPGLVPSGASGRTDCLIHAANWPWQLEGCLAIGDRLESIAPHGLGVTSSRATLAGLQVRWGDRRGLTATIEWAPSVEPNAP